jgi:hypothetical protein
MVLQRAAVITDWQAIEATEMIVDDTKQDAMGGETRQRNHEG